MLLLLGQDVYGRHTLQLLLEILVLKIEHQTYTPPKLIGSLQDLPRICLNMTFITTHNINVTFSFLLERGLSFPFHTHREDDRDVDHNNRHHPHITTKVVLKRRVV